MTATARYDSAGRQGPARQHQYTETGGNSSRGLFYVNAKRLIIVSLPFSSHKRLPCFVFLDHHPLSTMSIFKDYLPALSSLKSIPPPSQKTALITAGTIAFLFPIALIGILPYTRKATPKPKRPTHPLPEGVERVFTPEGLELLVAKPSTAGDGKKKLAPIFLQHGGFGTALTWELWLPYFASKGRTVYALSLGGKFAFSVSSGYSRVD